MSTKENLEREAASANEKLHEASDAIKSSARHAADDAQRTASAYAEQGKSAAATSLNDFASAVRKASDELTQRDQGVAAKLVAQAAESLEDVAQSVSGSSVNDVVGQVTGFARRNPAAFAAGAILAGLALGRFARATGERQPSGNVPAQTGYRPPVSPAAPGTATAGRPAVGPSNPTR